MFPHLVNKLVQRIVEFFVPVDGQMPHAYFFEEIRALDVLPSVAADAMIGNRFDESEVVFLIQFIFDYQTNMVKMTSSNPSNDTVADAGPPEQQNIASLHFWEEFLLWYSTKFPEFFLGFKLGYRLYVQVFCLIYV